MLKSKGGGGIQGKLAMRRRRNWDGDLPRLPPSFGRSQLLHHISPDLPANRNSSGIQAVELEFHLREAELELEARGGRRAKRSLSKKKLSFLL